LKISLRQEGNASVLDIEGGIDVHNFTVLKAGLTKLLGNGKNRIVLHIMGGENLATEVIRELAILDVFARELSGKLVLASADPILQQKVTAFAKPPVVPILPSVEKAIQYLNDIDSLEGDEAGESSDELQAKIESQAQEITALKAQVSQANAGEAQKLRSENALLKDKLNLLESQIAEFAGKRAQPSGMDGYQEKILALEATVKRLSGPQA
jgi:regulator of replication initiation timing/anti-anti-sigma regulatory factor